MPTCPASPYILYPNCYRNCALAHCTANDWLSRFSNFNFHQSAIYWPQIIAVGCIPQYRVVLHYWDLPFNPILYFHLLYCPLTLSCTITSPILDFCCNQVKICLFSNFFNFFKSVSKRKFLMYSTRKMTIYVRYDVKK